MGHTIAAGLLAGAVLALVLVVYVLIRGRALVAFFKSQGENIARTPDRTLFVIILASFVGVSFVLGALAGLVYGWAGTQQAFTAIGLGLAVLFSILAAVSRTPLIADKVVWNFAVGGVLGMLVPLFAGL